MKAKDRTRPNARRRWAPPLAVLLVLFLTLALAGTALAAIAFGTAANGQNGAASTLSITKPASTATGDFLLAQITFEKGSDISDANLTAPAGWTRIIRTNQSNNFGQAIYYKFVTASEPASYSWGFGQTVKAAGGILSYTGVRPVDPVNVSGGNSGENNPLTAPSVTTTEANTLLVTFFGVKKTTTLTLPSGMTARYTGIYFQNPQDVTVLAADVARPSSGATGARTSTAGSVDKWVAQSIALREASPAAVTLAAFEAQVGADGVTLAWETVSETDNAGFNVYRAAGDLTGFGETCQVCAWARLNAALIPAAAPGSSAGHATTWVDATAAPGASYVYRLEAVDLAGGTTDLGTVGVTPARAKRTWLPRIGR